MANKARDSVKSRPRRAVEQWSSGRLILLKNWFISSARLTQGNERKKERFLLFSKSVSRQFLAWWPKQNQGKFWSEQNLICQQWMREWWVSVFINTTHFTIKYHCSALQPRAERTLNPFVQRIPRWTIGRLRSTVSNFVKEKLVYFHCSS